MAAKMKGFFKGFKYITQIFVYREHELEIGYPTDVKHVTHIGWDNSSLNAPSWMNEFRSSSDFSSSSFSNYGSRQTSWADQDFEQPREFQPPSIVSLDHPRPDIPKAPKKAKRKKSKFTTPSVSSRSLGSLASYATAIEDPDDLLK